MSWGETGIDVTVAVSETVQRIFNVTTGDWMHRHKTATTHEQRGLSAAGAASFTPSGSGTEEVLSRQRVDESGQWVVTWDDVVLDPDDGTYHPGYSD